MFAIESDQGDFWGSAYKFSVSLGKVGFLWAHSLFQLPYLVDSRAWYLATKYGSVLLLLGTLYFTVFRVFKSSWIAVASLVIYLAFVQNGWDHNALTSYPLVVNFLLALFLVSLGLFLEAIERRSLAMAWVSAALYFLVLVNEFFVLYFPLYVAVAMAHGTAGTSIKGRIAASRRYILAIALALVGYLTLYVVWRITHTSEYGGTRPDGWRNLGAAAKVIVTYSLSAFPFASLHFLASPSAQAPFVNSTGFHALLAELRVESVVKALITGALFARLMFVQPFAALPRKVLLAGAAVAFVAIFLPNLLLALTKKYQGWVIDSGSTSYLYTYHSFVAAVIFGALVLALLYARSRHWRTRTRVAVLGAGIAVTMIVSLAVDVRNQYFAFDQKLSHRKWQLMDRVIASPAFERIEDGATLVAPTLGAHQRGLPTLPTTTGPGTSRTRQASGFGSSTMPAASAPPVIY